MIYHVLVVSHELVVAVAFSLGTGKIEIVGVVHSVATQPGQPCTKRVIVGNPGGFIKFLQLLKGIMCNNFYKNNNNNNFDEHTN